MRCDAMRCDAMRRDAMRCDAMRCVGQDVDALEQAVTEAKLARVGGAALQAAERMLGAAWREHASRQGRSITDCGDARFNGSYYPDAHSRQREGRTRPFRQA
jgi:hypothetical protein